MDDKRKLFSSAVPYSQEIPDGKHTLEAFIVYWKVIQANLLYAIYVLSSATQSKPGVSEGPTFRSIYLFIHWFICLLLVEPEPMVWTSSHFRTTSQSARF